MFDERGPILTAQIGRNAPLFCQVLSLYVPQGARVLDMTYGRGNFWTTVPPDAYRLVSMDMEVPAMVRGDLHNLPFRDACFDAVVLDPPYANHGAEHTTPIKESIARSYNLKAGNSTARIRQMYLRGIEEGRRVLASGGILIAKCQDAIESGKQQRIEHYISDVASSLGLLDEDTFVLVQHGTPTMRHTYQKHARKNHSYFRVWRKSGSIHRTAVTAVQSTFLGEP